MWIGNHRFRPISGLISEARQAITQNTKNESFALICDSQSAPDRKVHKESPEQTWNTVVDRFHYYQKHGIVQLKMLQVSMKVQTPKQLFTRMKVTVVDYFK